MSSNSPFPNKNSDMSVQRQRRDALYALKYQFCPSPDLALSDIPTLWGLQSEDVASIEEKLTYALWKGTLTHEFVLSLLEDMSRDMEQNPGFVELQATDLMQELDDHQYDIDDYFEMMEWKQRCNAVWSTMVMNQTFDFSF